MVTACKTQAIRLNATARRIANDKIHAITVEYGDDIPLGPMFEALSSVGVIAIDEDGQPWEGMLCGRAGRASIALASAETGAEYENCLVLSWFRLEVSNRYEVVAYVS